MLMELLTWALVVVKMGWEVAVGCVSISVDILILVRFPCGNGSELLTLKKGANIPVFVVYALLESTQPLLIKLLKTM